MMTVVLLMVPLITLKTAPLLISIFPMELIPVSRFVPPIAKVPFGPLTPFAKRVKVVAFENPFEELNLPLGCTKTELDNVVFPPRFFNAT